MDTPPIKTGDIQFTKHRIPMSPFYVGYAPKVNFDLQKFSWNELKAVAKQSKCAFIRFDVPNVLNQQNEHDTETKIISNLNKHCKKSPKNTFTKWNVLLDISKPEAEIQANLNQKTRYNSKLAYRKGVEAKLENNEKGLAVFLRLLYATAKRQGFLPHPNKYYQTVFETLYAKKMANILVAYYESTPIAAWMLFNYDRTLYYPYGGSSTEHRDLMASNLMAWEAIKLGQRLNCKLFDMWGATNDKDSPYWGFTKFKLGYGGELVEYIDSYDFIVNPFVYYSFNFSYDLFWKIRKLFVR